MAVKRLQQRYDNKSLVIQSHIRAILDCNKIESTSGLHLQALHSNVSAHVAALEALGQPIQHWDAWLVTIVLRKLDQKTSQDWQLRRTNTDLPRYAELENFLSNRCVALEGSEILAKDFDAYKNSQSSTSPQSKKSYHHNSARKGLFTSTDRRVKCACCSGEHKLYACNRFKELTIGERVTLVRDSRLCFNCLCSSHMANVCSSTFNCRICKRRHNTLLHFEKSTDPTQRVEIQTPQVGANSQNVGSQEPNISAAASLLAGSEQGYVFLSTAIILTVDRLGKQKQCRAVLDSGSQVNFISGSLANRLQLRSQRAALPVSGIGESRVQALSYVEVSIQSRLRDYRAKLVCYVLPTIVSNLPSCPTPAQGWQIPDNLVLKLADPSFNNPGTVDILIGGGVFFDVTSTCTERIPLNVKNIFLNDSQFGWLVTGELGAVCLAGIHSVGETLEENWRVSIGKEDSNFGRLSKANERSSEEKQTMEQFKQTTVRDEDGRFVVQLPKKSTVNELGATLSMATSRFLSVERRLQRDEALRAEYLKFMNEYIALGHMKEVVNESSVPKTTFYLPHHAVIKTSSLTTKVRVVFDASAKSSSDVSTNTDCKRRTDLQRILWRPSPNEVLRTYQLTTVTYGTTPASFLATQCLVSLGEEKKQQQPAAANAILRDFYMDDLMTGADSEEECYNLQREINDIFNSAKLPLRKWCSNSPTVLTQMGKREGDPLFTLEIGDNDTVKSLGLEWKPFADQFQFTLNTTTRKDKLTKRIVLSDLNKIFDPLGFLSPVLIRGKIYLQQIWAANMDWDRELQPNMRDKWLNFYHNLNELKTCAIPRKVKPSPTQRVEIHGFCDASEVAYGACIYVRSMDKNGVWHSKLLCAKTRVAPLKGATIPRLELNGALLLADLAQTVAESWEMDAKDFRLWTDSMIVLTWLNSQTSRLKSYVMNRVNQILELTEVVQWRHVRTHDNPADVTSRGIGAAELVRAETWWYGPKWLEKEELEWYSQPTLGKGEEEVLETRKMKLALMVTNPAIQGIISKYSEWNAMLRGLSWIVRYIKYLSKDKSVRETQHLQISELREAEMVILKAVQQECFRKEIIALEKGQQVPKNSKLRCLNPYMSNGLIRVGGRLENANIDETRKHPIFLPSSHKITLMIFESHHRELLHAGPQLLLSEVRRQYWPLLGRVNARSVVRRCVKCTRACPRFDQPLMAALPKDRVQCARPFTVTGIDFAGPIYVRSGLRRVPAKKAWIAIFICFSTKAIHLELAEDLSSSSFLAILRCFMARRGKCAKIYSDNGTNFVGAQKMLVSMMKGASDKFIKEGIEWHFNPPSAPHFGGLWESAVRSTKHHLKRVMGEHKLTSTELRTLLCQIEACLNSRPITPLSSDPSDLEALTPSHFLIGGPIMIPDEPDISKEPIGRLKRWKLVQNLMQTFWHRWSKEYLPQVQIRGKWTSKGSQLQKGDVVIIKEDCLPPSRWRLGLVIETHPGADGMTRVVTLRTKAGVHMRRPVVKLCRLPTQEEHNAVEKSDFQRGEDVEAK
ncbi:uncharacterized protein LOC126554977 [Aphis gossypii]|uniref:uncharacterized protein LOC126554977 n=1 Tax=Aphis gossypii TaxID=80765 RepID=UPI002158F708|nr:uncharacterized protein LOC126554977 [Aphis gossypii]